jgi:hypothetical protein
MYAMNLNFKLTSQKSKLAHYEENMKNSLYIYSGVSKCVLKQYMMQMTGYALKKNLCWLQKPGDSGYMSGVSGYVRGVSGPSTQNTGNSKSSQFK